LGSPESRDRLRDLLLDHFPLFIAEIDPFADFEIKLLLKKVPLGIGHTSNFFLSPASALTKL
jgi:hypothetical protein